MVRRDVGIWSCVIVTVHIENLLTCSAFTPAFSAVVLSILKLYELASFSTGKFLPLRMSSLLANTSPFSRVSALSVSFSYAGAY